MNYRSFLFVFCGTVMAFGNNTVLAEPVPSDVFTSSSKTAIRCYYRQDESNLMPETSYETGVDPSSRNDGEYEIKGYWSSKLDMLSKMFYTETTQDELLAICQYTLKKKNVDAPLAMVAAASTELSVNHTIWSIDPVWQNGNFNKIVAFGDSLSDTQNMYNGSRWLVPVKKNYFAGRFSNGKNWLDYLSESLHLPVYNWAVGGAGGGSEYDGLIKGIRAQVKSWVEYMDKDLAVNYRPENTLFTLLIGGNDLINYGRTPESIINKEREAIDIIIANGGKNILLLNLPDLSLAPILDFHSDSKRTKIAEQVLQYNAALANLVNDYQISHRDVTLSIFDSFSLLNKVLEQKERFKITNTVESCLEIEKSGNSSFLTYHKPRPTCVAAENEADSYLFWDLLHPTSRIHKILADNVLCSVQQQFAAKLNLLPNLFNNKALQCEM